MELEIGQMIHALPLYLLFLLTIQEKLFLLILLQLLSKLIGQNLIMEELLFNTIKFK